MKKLLLILVIALLISVGCRSTENTRIIESKNNAGEVIGTIAVTEKPEDEVTEDYLLEWYNSNIGENQYIILEYSDREYNGVYGALGSIITNVKLTPNPDGTFSYQDTENSEYYTVTENELIKQ